MPKSKLDEASIREAAYAIWLAEGQPEGREWDHWVKATEALTAAATGAPVKAKAPRKAATKPAVKADAKLKAKAKPKAAPKPRKPKAV